MKRSSLVDQIKKKKSFLCVGLDVDLDKIPPHLLQEKNPLLAFNKEIIAATKDLCVAYKPNIAFYEAYGQMGWEALEATMELIPEEIFTIADAKRGDIGNTAERYAEAFFKKMNFDSITLNPYMGKDCVAPFLEYEDKWAIVLGLTSNKGSEDFQMMEDSNGEALYERVIRIAASWGNPSNTMFVVGATKTDYIERIRKISPKHFYLVPGVGAQGGNLNDVCQYGKNSDIGLLINSTRGIIYQSKGKDFAEKARAAAIELQQEMALHI
ncbi:MAG: orotidine-5'-phosphate decarboxylase [Chitinophagales bacterium]